MLAREEWNDNCRYRYGFEPTNLPEYCDGCGERFTTEHGLNCKKGGLVHERHDDAADEWAYLAALAWHRECIFDIRLSNNESRSHQNKDP
jgi:hypothetical protein